MPFTVKTLRSTAPGGQYLDLTLVTPMVNGSSESDAFSVRIPFVNGAAAGNVFANDDAGTVPEGSYYIISIRTAGGRRSFPLVVRAAAASPIDLDTVVPSVVGTPGRRVGVADLGFDPATQVELDTALAGHLGALDPHTGYRLESSLIGTPDIADLAITAPKLGVVPHGRRSQITTPQTIANATDTQVTFNSTVFDSGGVALPNVNTLILPRAGLWLISYNLRWNTFAGTGTNLVAEWMLLNGVGNRLALNEQVVAATHRPTFTGSAFVRAAANDTVSLWCFQTTSGTAASRDLDLFAGMPYLEAAFISNI